MTKKTGKSGEMRFAIIIAGAGLEERDVDFKRYTITNQSDLGADFILRASPEFLNKFVQIGTSQVSDVKYSPQESRGNAKEARIDVKDTNSALSDDVVKKFISDVPKHPDIDLHILAGGSRLSNTANDSFEKGKQAMAAEGKSLVHIPNSGIERLIHEYKPTILKELGIEVKPPDED